MGDDSRQHGFEVESGADYLADFAEGFELAYRACQFVGSLIQFFEQADVLDGDHGLVGEGFEQCDLLFCKRADLGAANNDRADRDAFAQERVARTVRVPLMLHACLDSGNSCLDFAPHVVNMDRLPVEYRPADVETLD